MSRLVCRETPPVTHFCDLANNLHAEGRWHPAMLLEEFSLRVVELPSGHRLLAYAAVQRGAERVIGLHPNLLKGPLDMVMVAREAALVSMGGVSSPHDDLVAWRGAARLAIPEGMLDPVLRGELTSIEVGQSLDLPGEFVLLRLQLARCNRLDLADLPLFEKCAHLDHASAEFALWFARAAATLTLPHESTS